MNRHSKDKVQMANKDIWVLHPVPLSYTSVFVTKFLLHYLKSDMVISPTIAQDLGSCLFPYGFLRLFFLFLLKKNDVDILMGLY